MHIGLAVPGTQTGVVSEIPLVEVLGSLDIDLDQQEGIVGILVVKGDRVAVVVADMAAR